MNEAVPEAPSSVESMAKQGCEKLGLDTFDALVRRARTCRRFDESMRVPREFCSSWRNWRTWLPAAPMLSVCVFMW